MMTEAVVEADGLPTVHLPIEVNERVERWMRRFLTTDRRTFEIFLSRESIFSPIIRSKLQEREMP